jgi:hypothetical protein
MATTTSRSRPTNRRKKTSVKRIAPITIATVLVKGDADPRVDPNDLRTAFRESFVNSGRVIKLGQPQEQAQGGDQSREPNPVTKSMTPVRHRASGFCSTFCKVARGRCKILDNSWYDV